MKVTLTEMHSIRDAIRTMYMSKRTWNMEIEQQLKEMVDYCTDRYGRPLDLPEDDELKIKFVLCFFSLKFLPSADAPGLESYAVQTQPAPP